jgi:hypothetical protein
MEENSMAAFQINKVFKWDVTHLFDIETQMLPKYNMNERAKLIFVCFEPVVGKGIGIHVWLERVLGLEITNTTDNEVRWIDSTRKVQGSDGYIQISDMSRSAALVRGLDRGEILGNAAENAVSDIMFDHALDWYKRFVPKHHAYLIELGAIKKDGTHKKR